jgi:hypothetical protein
MGGNEPGVASGDGDGVASKVSPYAHHGHSVYIHHESDSHYHLTVDGTPIPRPQPSLEKATAFVEGYIYGLERGARVAAAMRDCASCIATVMAGEVVNPSNVRQVFDHAVEIITMLLPAG